jgi:UDP-glucose 4-epimerase
VKNVLVTGASGFIGQPLCSRLFADGWRVWAALRDSGPGPALMPGCERIAVGEIAPNTDWQPFLQKMNTVVHLAARVHVMREEASDPLAEFRRVNVEGTLNMARHAAAVGVQRFVYLSSVKVNGEETVTGQSFSEDDQPAPQDAYAVSKWEAEQGLRELAGKTGMEVVVIRPPLVYGPGVKANFLAMMQWLNRGIPLPLGAIRNKRSLVALDNLVDMIITCLGHPSAANQTFLAADGEDLSTPELLRRTGEALGKPSRLLPVPGWILEAGAVLVGKRAVAQRLCGSLQVDISKARVLLGWNPPQSVDQALRLTAHHFLESAGE